VGVRRGRPSPGVVLVDVQGVGVQQQPAPREEAAGGQRAHAGTRPRLLRHLEVDHHLLPVHHQTVVLNAGYQSPARGQRSDRKYNRLR